MKKIILILIWCLGPMIMVTGQEQQAEKLLSKAVYEEEVNGNLEEAIILFKEIVDDKSTNRTVKVVALYHLGLTNEKLGNKIAKEYYEQVISSYSDQPKTVQLAKNRLQYLTSRIPAKNVADAKINNPVNVRKIFSGSFYGNVSPDGKYLSYVEWETGNIAVHNLETGKNRLITNEGTWKKPTKFGDISVWSPDGKFLAYYWINNGENNQLRVQNLETGEDRTLIQSSENKCPRPMEWTSDGKYLVATTTSDNFQTNTLQLVSVKDGSVKIIKMLGDQCACGGASISPDGKYIVVSSGNEIDKRDIHILSVDGTLNSELISFPGADWAPKWTPDGQKVIFASNRSGSPALWTVKVKDGQKVDEPALIYEGIPDIYTSLRFTNDGKFLFLSEARYSIVFLATIKPDEGIIEIPTPITSDRPGLNTTPFWSPDGSKIAYIFYASRGDNIPIYDTKVIIRDLKTGKEKELKLGLRGFLEAPFGWAWPQWSKDSESLLLSCGDKVVIVNIETEDKKFLKGGHSWKVFGPENTILYVDSLASKIIQQNISTNKEKILYESNKQIYHLTISEDKTTLAFFVRGGQQKLYCMPINSSEPKMLWEATKEQSFTWSTGLNFFPDGKTLLLGLSTKGMEKYSEKSQQFYTININTLEKKPLGKELTDSNRFFGHVRLSPDGKKIAFSKGKKSKNIWSLEFDF